MGFLRRIFGLPRRKERLGTDGARVTDAETEEWLLKTRSRRMGNLGAKHLELQLKDLLHVLNGTIQEIEVVKDMFKERQLWDEDLYRKLRIKRMIEDHSMAGEAPWKGRAMYPYTLEDKDFLRHKFDASDDEVTKFRSEVERVSSELT
jgi:hypothetical protein